MDEYDCLIRL